MDGDEPILSKLDKKINVSISIRDILYNSLIIILVLTGTVMGYSVGKLTALQNTKPLSDTGNPFILNELSAERLEYSASVSSSVTQNAQIDKSQIGGKVSTKYPGTLAQANIDPVAWMLYPGTGPATNSGSGVADATQQSAGSGKYVASKNGAKYYPIDCSSANRIKAENRVFFDSAAEAERAGYGESQQCEY